MVLFTMEIGISTKRTVKANSNMLTEMFTMATGWEIKLVDLGSTLTPKDRGTRVTGKTTNNTAQAMKPGLRVPAIEASISKVKKKAKESTSGLMDQFMKVTGKTTKLMALVSIFGLTAENIMDSGETTTCLDMEFIYTPTV
jgi:hypothetical protein